MPAVDTKQATRSFTRHDIDRLVSNSPFTAITTKAWWHRHLDPDERRRVMDELAMDPDPHWAWRFTAMLTLSVVVAVMGLSANSAAIVIGAMLLAPLMQPVLAAAASLSMSLMQRSAAALARVALATAWCIFVAYLLSRILPDIPLSSEVEARTRPDIRDLVVALAAGAAGAYATVRKDASSALPGVAVAVALVPPLATIGITLEAGKPDLVKGAALLYGTNLAAIIFAGVMVFIATGFVPPRRLASTAVQLFVAAIMAGIVVLAVAVPLYNRSLDVVSAVDAEVTANAIVNDWLNGVALSSQVDVSPDRILVQLQGFEPPPDDLVLIDAIQRRFGNRPVLVEWVRTERATTTTLEPLTDEQILLLDVSPVVDSWVDELAADTGEDYQLDRIRLDGDTVKAEISGTGPAPSAESLVDRLAADVGQRLAVNLIWTPKETITPRRPVEPVEALVAELESEARIWATEMGLHLGAFSYRDNRISVELIGTETPAIDGLVARLGSMVVSEVEIDVLFTLQQRLTTTTAEQTNDESTGAGSPDAEPTPTTLGSAEGTTTATTAGP